MKRPADARHPIDRPAARPTLSRTAQLGLVIVLFAFAIFVFIRVR